MTSDAEAPFTFPQGMPRPEAEQMLAETYQELDAGRLLRRALKIQRSRGWDPPADVQYVVEPHVVEAGDRWGLVLHSDIMLYDAFPGVDECVDIFEDVVADALLERLEKKFRKWQKRHGR